VLEDEREGLLGGEATEAHRTRHNDARIAAQAALQDAERALADARAVLAGREAALAAAVEGGDRATDRAARADAALAGACAAAGLDLSRVVALHAAPEAEVAARQARLAAAEAEQAQADGALAERAQALQALTDRGMPDTPPDVLAARQTALDAAIGARGEQMGRLAERQWADTEARARLQDLERAIDTARGTAETWAAVNDAIGSASGDRFAQIAQAVTLALLVDRANLHLHDLKPRYRLRVADTDLALLVADLDMAGEVRTTRSLSGGERFLVSLALALGLSSMGSRGALAGTLFIDEGFGSLDADSLDLAIDALERLQAQGRTVGVISHVQAMKDRIPVQVEVKRIGGGASVVRLKGV
jgi:exonuclease SbcC